MDKTLEDFIIEDCHKYIQTYGIDATIVLGVRTAEILLHKHGMNIYGILGLQHKGNKLTLEGFELTIGAFDYGYYIR